jgi:hypothetical protein
LPRKEPLIDFADLRIHPWALGKYLRTRNVKRMLDMEEERGWIDFEAIVSGRSVAAGAGQ